jgi:membrane fusion protein, multidrug efflux system
LPVLFRAKPVFNSTKNSIKKTTMEPVNMKYPAGVIKHRFILMGLAVVIALGIGVVWHSAASANIHTAPPSPMVAVQTVSLEGGLIWSEFSGHMQAVDDAEIRPEVSGRITEVRFRDGQTVRAGDVLFVIDPQPYEAAVAKSQADLASSAANAQLSKVEFDRATSLLQQQAIPQSTYDERANTYHVTLDAVAAAEAELKMANVDLDHAYIKAPITGRVSRAEITLGNLVQSGSGAPLLASVVSNNGIYADFEVDEQTYIKSIRNQADTQAKARRIPVELIVQGSESHPYKGTIYSFDNHIDPSSGTIRARARFANQDGSLVPGMFVSVRLASHVDTPELLVPEQAVGYDQNKKFVFVVDANHKVVYHEVTLGDEIDGKRVVLSGLQSGDRVIVDGLQHVRPDMTVQIQNETPIRKTTVN